MLQGAKETLRRVRFRHRTLRAPVVRWRHRGLTPRDAFLASYPRSGTTWLRFLLFEALTGEPSAFGLVRTGVPAVGLQQVARPMLDDGGRIVQTHEPYCDRDRRVVYVVRDVRSVVVSEYRWQRLSGTYTGAFEGFFADFLAGRTNPWGSWGDHVAFWRNSASARAGHLHLIRYEDLRRDPQSAFTGVLEFLGAHREPDEIARAIRNNSLEAMRAKEDESRRRKGASPRSDLRFVNTGSTKGWQETLTPAQLDALEGRFRPPLESLGYEVSSAHAPPRA